MSATPEANASAQPGADPGAGSPSGTVDTSPGAGADAAPPVEPDPRRWLALAVMAAATLMVVLDVSIINLALPRAQAELGMSDASRGWVVTAYTVTFGGLLLLGGRVSDLLGRKRTFLIGLLGFAAASAIGGLAPTAGVLFAARAGQGVFAALLTPAALSLVSVTFVEPAEHLSWRWCLFVNVPIALVAALAAIPTVPRQEAVRGPRRYDVPGAITVTAASVVLVFGVTLAGEGEGWLAPAPLALIGAAVILLVVFIAIERTSAHPLLPLRVVTDRVRGGSFITLG